MFNNYYLVLISVIAIDLEYEQVITYSLLISFMSPIQDLCTLFVNISIKSHLIPKQCSYPYESP